MSNHIHIKHNPFTVSTEFLIDGYEPDWDYIKNIKGLRFQLWVEELPHLLYNNLNGQTNFNITFQGTDTDYADLCQIADQAHQEQGIQFTIHHQPIKGGQERLEEIERLMQEAMNNPLFKDSLSDPRSEIRREFNAAFNKDFDVYVAATMSAGKSTLINAMLGCDLLPAANEATTATIAQITDNDSMQIGHFNGVRYDKSNQPVDTKEGVDLQTLKDWNGKDDTKIIKLEGNIVGVQERETVRLVLTDTPGPNNSQDEEHYKTTMSYIQNSSRNPLILYILNATQLGINDDKSTLETIAKQMQRGGKQAKDRFIFVVNKADEFDPEKGESIKDMLGRVRKYLKGIENPLIYPVSANLARLVRKQELGLYLTRSERGELSANTELFLEEPSMDMEQYMKLSHTAKANLDAKPMSELLRRSGVPAIEAMIDDYIDKYNLPERVNRAYKALEAVISTSSNEAKVTQELNNSQEELTKIQGQLSNIVNNKDVTARAKRKLEETISNTRNLIPKDILRKFDNTEAEARKIIDSAQADFFSNYSYEPISPKVAKKKLNALERNINKQSSILINELENIFEEAQEYTQENLKKVLNEHVNELFDDIQVPTLVLDGLKDRVKNIGTLTGMGLKNEEIDIIQEEITKTRTETRRVKTGERSTSKWYNPFSWGSKESIYEDRDFEVEYTDYQDKEVVDLDQLWDEREYDIREYLDSIAKDARKNLENEVKKYARNFKDFIEGEFELKTREIIKELTQLTGNKEELEKRAEEAERELARIQEFKAKLIPILEL